MAAHERLRGSMLSRRMVAWWLVVGILALALFPAIAEKFYLQLITKIMILSIFALSLDLLVGYAGLVSLGHAAFFGVAAYTLALAAPASDAPNLWLTLPLALMASAITALAIGALVIRTAGVYFIMVTLAFAQMVYYFFHDTRFAGGSDGIYVSARPSLGIGPIDLADDLHFYYLVLAALGGVFILLGIVLRSPFGRALQGIKANEQRMRALGFPTLRYKLAAFVLAGTLAGLAGYLAAAKEGYVNPELLAWHQSGTVLMMLILGGMGTLFGAVIGAFSYVLLQEWFSNLTRHWQLLMGGFIILAVLVLPRGIAGLGQRMALRRTDTSRNDDEA
jgi:branched-chain amino acid transport system permease protein